MAGNIRIWPAILPATIMVCRYIWPAILPRPYLSCRTPQVFHSLDQLSDSLSKKDVRARQL